MVVNALASVTSLLFLQEDPATVAVRRIRHGGVDCSRERAPRATQ